MATTKITTNSLAAGAALGNLNQSTVAFTQPVTVLGNLSVSGNTSLIGAGTFVGNQIMSPNAANVTPLSVKGFVGQTASLFDARDSNNAIMLSFGASNLPNLNLYSSSANSANAGTITFNTPGSAEVCAITFDASANQFLFKYGSTSILSLNSGGVTLTGTINTTGSAVINGHVQVGGNNEMRWDSRAVMTATSDGVILLRNWAINNFDRIQLGGTTSLFPAIKRNGAGIDFKLADDSAFTSITVASATVPIINGNTTFSNNIIGNGTDNTLPNQTAASTSSVITRNLLTQEVFQQCPIPLSWGSPSGTTNSSGTGSGGAFQLTLNGPTAVAGNYREVLYFANSPINRSGSATQPSFLNSRFSVMFDIVYTSIVGTSNEIRFLAGVSSEQSLSAAGMGFVIPSNNNIKLQIHNGSTLVESALFPIASPTDPMRILLVWNGVKLVIGVASSIDGVYPRFTKIGELTHGGVIPSTYFGPNWKFVNMATGTTTNFHTLVLRSGLFAPYEIVI